MTDYIIVGAGLSGIALAEELTGRGKTIKVFENNSQSSSTVAGGVYNPVILKRFTLAWNAAAQMETAIPFYKALEEKLGVNLVEELPIYRKFNSIEEQNNWFTAADKRSLAPFLDTGLKKELNPCLPSQHSFGRVIGTGRIDTALLLEKYWQFLNELGVFFAERFEYQKLQLLPDGVAYKSHKARRVVFCEGFGLKKNPFFNSLPLYGNKGEYIIIKAPSLKLQVAVKSSVFILPLGNELYKVGATYNNQDTSEEPTEEARESLLSKLRSMITCEFEIVDQVAGIRPATKDRKPVVGQHPEHLQLYCCNGFGSRGVLMAPCIARELAAHLEEGAPLDQETSLLRFLK
ncbi:FAD-binding oxidoreductase [Antarcticibacterium flavum]|uniref:FAD-binding oxidoreductase n=1 Tax=Antarcticibacterium flavum TaxID=2058175 RepID=A0A5B7X4D1_9FLAO|nr:MULTISPECIES: FAD-dependent oxidoreductase [Antarcticibacterium]MCM4158420.1 FAD-dependent oxidoreductase [Antarcticibacterium sp. W02-3]QCY70179.1 FAD-binding oxidoreductase [Antarcticibacterium flavum]